MSLPQRRKEDPIIVDIYARLDKLEAVYEMMQRIEEWMASVTKVFHGVEIIGCFCGKWATRFIKVGVALAAAWAAVRLTAHEAFDFLRGLMSK